MMLRRAIRWALQWGMDVVIVAAMWRAWRYAGPPPLDIALIAIVLCVAIPIINGKILGDFGHAGTEETT